MTKNHFSVLGLKPGVTDDDVKKAYRTLAKKYHPDKNKEFGAEEKFKEIGAAYEVLKNRDRREIYEREINRPREGFVRTEFKTQGGKTFQNNYRAKEEYYDRRRSEPPPNFKFDDEPFTGPYSKYRYSKGYQEKEHFNNSNKKSRPAGKKRPQEKPKWNNHWHEEDDVNFHDNGDKSSFSFAFRSFMDDMDFSMSFTLDGDQGFSAFFGDADPFSKFFDGPGVNHNGRFKMNNKNHKKNVAGEHGYKGGLDDDYLFTPRSELESSESEDSDDDDFDYTDMRFTCAFCGKRLRLEDLKLHEPACGQRRKMNINIDSDGEGDKNGYRKMFQEKTGDWRRDHEKFQEYVKRAKRAYKIKKSNDASRMEEKLLCSLCGKVIDRGEARTHSLFCHSKDPHFGPRETNSEDPPMKDSKFKRAKEYAKKKVPKFKKSFSSDDQPNPKTKGRDTMDEPLATSGTGLNPSQKSRFGKTKKAPAPPPTCPGPTTGPAPTKSTPSEEVPSKQKPGQWPTPTKSSPREEVPMRQKAGQRTTAKSSPRDETPSKLRAGQRASFPLSPDSNLPSTSSPESSPQKPSTQISSQESLFDQDPSPIPDHSASSYIPKTSSLDDTHLHLPKSPRWGDKRVLRDKYHMKSPRKENSLMTPRTPKNPRGSSASEKRNDYLPDIDDHCSEFSAFNCTPRDFLRETTVKI